MRLIDAENLADAIAKHNFKNTIHRKGDLKEVFVFEATKGDMFKKVITAPEVEAIPVEWLESLFKSEDWNEEHEIIEGAIQTWRLEREEKG